MKVSDEGTTSASPEIMLGSRRMLESLVWLMSIGMRNLAPPRVVESTSSSRETRREDEPRTMHWSQIPLAEPPRRSLHQPSLVEDGTVGPHSRNPKPEPPMRCTDSATLKLSSRRCCDCDYSFVLCVGVSGVYAVLFGRLLDRSLEAEDAPPKERFLN